MKTIVLKPKKEESVLRSHPWVFSGAIAFLPEDLEEGELVRVESSKKEFLGIGHYQIGSIAVRLLAFPVLLVRVSIGSTFTDIGSCARVETKVV